MYTQSASGSSAPQGLAQLHVSPDPDSQHIVLTLQPGQFLDCIMPENIEQLWGPVLLPRLPAGTDNKCIAATHRFNFHSASTLFYSL